MNPADHLMPQANKPVQHGLTPLGAKYHKKSPASPLTQSLQRLFENRIFGCDAGK
jgi:hypothetical protein